MSSGRAVRHLAVHSIPVRASTAATRARTRCARSSPDEYRYCCEKVFSFATDDDDTLAVKADKWGGCCVDVVVSRRPAGPRARAGEQDPRLPNVALVLAMVIDPGMFDKPVLLSTWLVRAGER